MILYDGNYIDAKGRVLQVTQRWYKWNKGRPQPTQVDILNTKTQETLTYPFEQFLSWLEGNSIQKIK